MCRKRPAEINILIDLTVVRDNVSRGRVVPRVPEGAEFEGYIDTARDIRIPVYKAGQHYYAVFSLDDDYVVEFDI